MRAMVRKVCYWVAWNLPRLYLWLIINLRLRKSEYFKLVRASKLTPAQELPAPIQPTPDKLNESKRILFVIHWYELGGAESYALYTIRTARELGYACFCISTVPSANSERDAFAEHCKETLAYSPSEQDPNFERFVADFITKRRIDIVHIHHSAAMYESLPSVVKNVPQVLVVDSTHIVEYGNGGFAKLSAVHSDYIHRHNVISWNLMTVQSELHKRIHGSSLQVSKFLLTYLASLSGFAEQLPRKTGEKRCVVTFFGRFVLQKQPNIFLAVIERIASENPGLGVEAHIYGAGELASDLKKRLAKSPHQGQFRLFGRCDDPKEVLAESDILFLPSLNEGLSLTAYEALALGRLVVSSDVGAQSELLAPECLVPLSPKFIGESAEKLRAFLLDERAYDQALEESKRKLDHLRQHSVNKAALSQLYQEA